MKTKSPVKCKDWRAQRKHRAECGEDRDTAKNNHEAFDYDGDTEDVDDVVTIRAQHSNLGFPLSEEVISSPNDVYHEAEEEYMLYTCWGKYK